MKKILQAIFFLRHPSWMDMNWRRRCPSQHSSRFSPTKKASVGVHPGNLTLRPLKIGRLPQKERRTSSNHHFSGAFAVSFLGGKVFALHICCGKFLIWQNVAELPWSAQKKNNLLVFLAHSAIRLPTLNYRKLPLTFHCRHWQFSLRPNNITVERCKTWRCLWKDMSSFMQPSKMLFHIYI